MKVIAIAPSRISLFGGGTDLDPYASEYGGLCLNMAINIRHKIQVNSLVRDEPWLQDFDDQGFFDVFEKELGLTKLRHEYDNSIEGGLGSSASLAVAIVGVANRLHGWGLSLAQIAEKAWDIEVNKLKMFGGKQDQYASAFGGVNVMEFGKDGVKVTSLARGFIEPLFPSLVLLYTGFKRKSAVIQEAYKDLTNEKRFALDAMKAIAVRAVDPIANGNIEEVGALLDESWELKKQSNPGASNSEVDALYEKAKELGALGGKCCGAGGGGHMLFIVPPEKKEKFVKEMGLKWVDFSISWDGLETRIIE